MFRPPLILLMMAASALGADPVVRAQLSPSRAGFSVECFSPDGVTPAPIAAFGGLNEVQSLTIEGTPASRSFTLTYGSATTSGIPFQRAPPSTSIAFNVAITPGQYDVQVCTPAADTSPINTYSVYDGVVPVGKPFSFALGSAVRPISGHAAPHSVDGSGTTAHFRPIGRFTFATSLAIIEATSALGVPIYASAVRLVPVAGGAPIVWRMDNPANTGTVMDRTAVLGPIQTNFRGLYGNGFYTVTTQIDGSRRTVTPTFWYADPATVRSAIAALPGFTANGTPGVAASSPLVIGPPGYNAVTTAPPGVVTLAFSGPKGAMPIGAPSASDPAVSAAVAHSGGRPITLDVGGTSTTITPAMCAISLPGRAPQSYFYVPLPSPVQAGVTPTLDWPAGAILTAAGPVAALVASPLAPYQVPNPAAPTMPLGWNVHNNDNHGPVPFYSNLAQKFPASGQGTGNYLAYRPVDASGTVLPNLPNDRKGVWTVTWTGPTAPTLGVNRADGSSVRGTITPVSAGRRTITGLSDPGSVALQVYCLVPAGTVVTGVYPPGRSPEGTMLDPDALRFLAMGPVRTLDWTGAAASNLVRYADWADPRTVGRVGNVEKVVPIASIVPDTSGVWPAGQTPLLVTTKVPHGLGQGVLAGIYAGPKRKFAATWTLDGKPLSPGPAIDGGFMNPVRVVSPTRFSILAYYGGPGIALRSIDATGANLVWSTSPGIPPSEQARMLGEVQAVNPASVPYINIPALADDDCIARIARAFLPLKGKIRFEYANEPWNYSGPPVYAQMCNMTVLRGLGPYNSYPPGYVTRAGEAWAIVERVYAAAGRPGDVIRVLGGQAFNPDPTVRVPLQYAKAKGIAVHEVAIAPYTRFEIPSDPNPPQSATLAAIYAGLTADQAMDLALVTLPYGPIAGCYDATRSAIQASGMTRPDGTPIPIIAYEGGLEGVSFGHPNGSTPGGSANPAFYSRQLATFRHPLMKSYHYLQAQINQKAGCVAYHEFKLQSTYLPYTWGKDEFYNQQVGTGSRSDPPLSNQIIAGYRAFAAAAPGTVTPTPTPSPSPSHSRPPSPSPRRPNAR